MLRSNSTNQLKSRAVLASKFFDLQGHGCLVSAKCAPFESVGKTAVAGKHVAVLWEIADFSARNL
jgi:hypothetical protein